MKAFQQSKGDQQVRRYLALAIGRLDPPLPVDAVADLTHALDDPTKRGSASSGAWTSGDLAVVPRLVLLYTAPDADAGIRKMVVYALGALPGDTQVDTRDGLRIRSPTRWNAACSRVTAMAGAGVAADAGSAICGARRRGPHVRRGSGPIADVMIAVCAAVALKDETPRRRSRPERAGSHEARQAAIEALKAIG